MVSATENVTTDLNNNGLELPSSEITVEDNVLESEDVGTFSDLDHEIGDNSVVNLTKNYKYNSNDDDYKNGVPISSVTINGNGHTIDGSNLARIFSISSGTVTLKNIKFINAHSPKEANGGAIYITSGNLILENCIFENNLAEKHGGAVGISNQYSSATIQVTDSTFNDNSASYHGGAIYSKDLVVDNSIFDSNRVTAKSVQTSDNINLKGLGGAIFSSNANVRNSKFNKNWVRNSGIYQIDEGGGAITVTHKLSVDHCEFTENTGLKGGAIIAIYEQSSDLVPSNYVTITDSLFERNVAFDGGAICSNYNMTVDSSVFNQNTATGYGGGAINTGYKSNDNYFKNSIFFNNTADNYGGALATSHSHIRNCTFEYNKARHGGAIFSLSFDIANSTLHDNVATVGNNIVVVDGFKKDEATIIPESEFVIYRQDEVHDFSVDVLNGQDASEHFIKSGKFEGYQQYCVEEHLYLPSNTEGVLTTDLSYITNAITREVVYDYLKIMFYLQDAYPEKYSAYSTQSITWIFTDSDFRKEAEHNQFVKDIVALHDDPNFNINKTTYILPNGTIMEYDMKLFLTPTDRQNMVLFKSSKWIPVYNESVTKKTLDTLVTIGENVRFLITVTNTGNTNLTEVFVKDVDYSKGLVYDNWQKDNGKWSYDGKGKWTLGNVLHPGENASFIVIFKTKTLGELRNNVTSGYMNYTLSNSTNITKTIYKPKMSVRKITNNFNVTLGKEVSFTILVSNDGDHDITGLYAEDNDYSEGLEYDYFVDRTSTWKYKGNHRWEYDGVLKAHTMAVPLVLFFMTNKTGILNNTVVIGSNVTNDTVKSTNKTNVTNKTVNNNTTKHNKTHNITKKSYKKHVVTDKNATGNPLYALILVLIALGYTSSRRKK